MDKKACIIELEKIILQIRDIENLFGENSLLLNSVSISDAQEKLKSLKQTLKTAHKTRSTVKGKNNMTDVEKHFFYPAIHQVDAFIIIKSNSIPNEKWLMKLKEARQTLNYHLKNLVEHDE